MSEQRGNADHIIELVNGERLNFWTKANGNARKVEWDEGGIIVTRDGYRETLFIPWSAIVTWEGRRAAP